MRMLAMDSGYEISFTLTPDDIQQAYVVRSSGEKVYRKQECKNGHPFDGRRSCKACNRERARRNRALTRN